MAAKSFDIIIACKGDPGETRAMWLAISRSKKEARGREPAFAESSSGRGKKLGSFFSSSVIDTGACINSFHKENVRGNPEKFYSALAKAFPGLRFFIIQRGTGDSFARVTSFEAKNGRPRMSGSWEYENRELCEVRQAWLEALQGHWLRDGEAPPEPEAGTGGEDASSAREKRGRGEKTAFAQDLEAVRADGEALGRVKGQTPGICLAAVQNSGRALRFVKKQSAKICRAALRQDGLALEFVRGQTRELCLAAVKQNYLAYRFVRETTPSIFRLFNEGFQKRMDGVRASHQTAT
jgi:hypothetical protein